MIYLHLGSDDSITLFPKNTNTSFLCNLPDTIHLDGTWECALSGISGDLAASYNVFCDFIEYSVIKGTRLPILRRVTRREELQNLQFVKVSQASLNKIHIYITDSNLKLLKTSSKNTHCTLCLRKCG